MKQETSDSPIEGNKKEQFSDEIISQAKAILTKAPEVPGDPIAQNKGSALPYEAPEQAEADPEPE